MPVACEREVLKPFIAAVIVQAPARPGRHSIRVATTSVSSTDLCPPDPLCIVSNGRTYHEAAFRFRPAFQVLGRRDAGLVLAYLA